MLIRKSKIFMYNIINIKTSLFYGLTFVLYVLLLPGSNGYMDISLTFLISFQNNLNKPCRSGGFSISKSKFGKVVMKYKYVFFLLGTF